MESPLFFRSAAAALLALSGLAAAQSAPGGPAASDRTTSPLTVSIPGVVGIDVESDVAFNLSSYMVASRATTGACPANVFPPPAGCSGAAVYAATSSATTAGVPGAVPASGAVWMSVFCNRTVGTLTISQSVAAGWSGLGPGFPTTALRTRAGSTNNGPAAGFAAATNLTTGPVPIGSGTLPAQFTWTRVDQLFDLAVPNASTVSFNAGAFTTTVTFTISKS
jgi:hypothetical protein